MQLIKNMRLFFFIVCLIPFALWSKEDPALVSFYAVDMSNGKVIADLNSDITLMPASCLKIVTTASALHIIGPDYRFETHLEYDGFIDSQNTLQGNIYIRGGGDPSLGSERCSLSCQGQIEVWANAIEAMGIQKIKGTLIGDSSLWESALAPASWLWEDLGNYYGAGASALSFHENYYSLVFKPATHLGEKATIVRTEPPMDPLEFKNEVTTGPPGSGDCACIYGSEYSSRIFVRGTIPAGVDEFVIKGSFPDPANNTANLLARELEKRGVIFEKEFLKAGKRVAFHTTYSPPIKEIVYWTNHKSINLYAEHLLKKMGELLYQEGSTLAGTKALMHFLRKQKINVNGIHIADGSGLSRKNLISTKQLVEVLVKMKESLLFPIFLTSLPQKSDLIRGKSGSFSSVKGYVGYAGDIAFAILINNCSDNKLLNEKLNLFISNIE